MKYNFEKLLPMGILILGSGLRGIGTQYLGSFFPLNNATIIACHDLFLLKILIISLSISD